MAKIGISLFRPNSRALIWRFTKTFPAKWPSVVTDDPGFNASETLKASEPNIRRLKTGTNQVAVNVSPVHFTKSWTTFWGIRPSVQPLELLDSCFVQEEPEEESPGPAAVAASVASRSFGDTGDGTLVAFSPSASTCDESSAASEDTSVNSHASSTPTASTTCKSRKRKSKMEATLEVFADKITSALKDDDTDLLLKMQAAQDEHGSKMFAMISQFMERPIQPPQPPFYQAPTQPSQIYNSIRPPTHHSTRFPVASSPSPTQPLPFFQDLNRPLPSNNTHPHLTQ
ncbi:uncharacterized protein [Paramisgurnus dabryanus]|uniref:uncharacterized protein n=1 Tax=Paramisgurnus dabryanus TaxID=90735 RepID=UPI0031F34AB1